LITEAAAGVGAYYVWRLNSIYDPDYTGTGNVASGYNEMSNLWGRYRVLRTRVVINFANSSGGAQLVGLSAGLNATIGATSRTWPVQPRTMCKISKGTVGGPYGCVHFDVTYDLAKVAGITKAQYKNENDYGGLFGSNPSANLFLWTWVIGESGNAESTLVDARIFYDVELYAPIQSVAT